MIFFSHSLILYAEKGKVPPSVALRREDNRDREGRTKYGRKLAQFVKIIFTAIL